MSVLINGSPTKDFKVHKGLRQEDPLSPFLFLIAAEGLTGLVNKAINIGKFQGFKVHDNLQFPILQFADDTVLICEGSWVNVSTIKTILRGFELVSGMKINFVKSKIYGINVDEFFLEAAANFLLCRAETIPFKFLGLPVGANPRRLNTWKPVVDSMKQRLSSWSGRHLSIGGRVTLINSVLSSLPLYFFSFFKAPKGVINELIKIQRNFLWGGGLEVKKLCWVSWVNFCLPKDKGGLGVKDLELFNQSLLCKWKWRLLVDTGAVWYGLLRFRYENQFDNLLSRGGLSPKATDSIWWRDMVRVGDAEGEFWFPKNVSSILGNGKRIVFWKEKWIGTVPLQELFPNLFAKESNQSVEVAKRLIGNSLHRTWNWEWITNLTAEEEEGLQELQELLLDVAVVENQQDKWRWIPDSSGLFAVKSVYVLLLNNITRHDLNRSLVEALECLWKNDILQRLVFLDGDYFGRNYPQE
ncbi:hypothetical protein TSUD_369510 [Trifolium subterraneum]|uniref:Reverse transcriptase domain-containing protein n=1 Tax=Trifolium subterraneum TaxID=3900 RepID=A0A2Z6PDM6_TRISU|nr:hypothetical protein TSUD_369510 [Trifolium subterraneum]